MYSSAGYILAAVLLQLLIDKILLIDEGSNDSDLLIGM